MYETDSFGFGSFFADQMAAIDPALRPARVAWSVRGRYGLLGVEPAWGELAGRLEYHAENAEALPCVGDWVAVRCVGGSAIIEAVLSRRGRIARKEAGRAASVQVLAANVDTLFIVTAVGADFNVRRLERYLLVAKDAAAEPVIVLNKIDLTTDVAGLVADIATIAGDTPVLPVSAETGAGVDALRARVPPGATACLVGSSGVGKSSLTNRLLGEALQATREVRVDDDKGRHTTVRRELFVLPGGGLLIDTPGMRELQPWGDTNDVRAAFADIDELAGACRYRDCTHETEPGCAVLAAVEGGELDEMRLIAFQKLLREQAFLERRRDAAAQRQSKLRWKNVTKSMRQRAKIDPKIRKDKG